MLKILMRNELKKEIAVVVGTRPGIIKFSPVIRSLKKRDAAFFIIHTGQHYSYNMDRQFFQDLNLPEPRYKNEKICNETLHGAQTAEMIKSIERNLLDSKPLVVVVGGDANTNLAGALASRKLGITLAHMEAGLRSKDWRMPEEHNRVMIDHISDILFAPTEEAKENLMNDNVKGKIYVVGNSIVDAVYQNIEIAHLKSKILKKLNVKKKDYFLLTIHREENVDYMETLKKLIYNVKGIVERYGKEVIFPIHPRTKKRLEQYDLWEFTMNSKKIRIIEAVGYLDFLVLLKNAKVVLTDSGGIQEESCILKVPCITLRENTERPETIEVGANKIVGSRQKDILSAIKQFESSAKCWENPFGDGKASEKIVDIIMKSESGLWAKKL